MQTEIKYVGDPLKLQIVSPQIRYPSDNSLDIMLLMIVWHLLISGFLVGLHWQESRDVLICRFVGIGCLLGCRELYSKLVYVCRMLMDITYFIYNG